MDMNPLNSSEAAQAPISQTGSPQKPIQVENVQYNVKVGSFFSRTGFAFVIASSSLAVLVLGLAYVLQGVTGQMFDFEKDVAAGRIVLLISLAVPLLPLYLFSVKRLRKLIENPANLEDVIFKKRLRNVLWTEIVLGVWYIAFGIYQGLNVLLLAKPGNTAEGFSAALFYGGAFALLAWWSYSFQKLTQR